MLSVSKVGHRAGFATEGFFPSVAIVLQCEDCLR